MDLENETDQQLMDESNLNPDGSEMMRRVPSTRSKVMSGRTSKNRTQISSVVKLFVEKVVPSHTHPWKMKSESCNGTGFIISENRILTNAHVAHRGQSILCRAQSSPKKWECTIESISIPLDLAVIKVTDPSFFDGKTALKLVEEGFENLPHLDDNVTCVGYPKGGDQISVTRGVVSRITTSSSYKELLLQIDAAINPGNSGGPVFNEKGGVVGVARSVLRNSANIGYIIPSTIVHMFLKSTVETNGKCNPYRRCEKNPEGYCGVASLGISDYQQLENLTLRKHLGLENRDGGIRVCSVDPLGACSDLKPNDVLMKVNGVPIGEDGTVELPGRPEERVYWGSIVSSMLPTTPLDITYIRKGEEYTKQILPTPRKFLIPRADGFDTPDPPQYLICGGCVFTQVTASWLHAKKRAITSSLLVPLPKEGQQVIILNSVLASSINVGYHRYGSLYLRSVNKERVFSLQHLATLLEKLDEPTIEFRLSKSFRLKDDDEKNSEEEEEKERQGELENEFLIVLETDKCKEMDPKIREAHLIHAPSSSDIEFKWSL